MHVDGSEPAFDFLLGEPKSKGLFGILHPKKHGRGGKRSWNSREVSGVILEVEIAPSSVDVFGLNEHRNLFVSELLEPGEFCLIPFSIVIEIGNGSESVSMPPDIVGRGRVEVSEFGEFLKEPGFGLVDGRNDLGASVPAIEEATQGEGGGPGPKGEMGIWNRSVDIQPLGAGGAAPRSILVLLADEIVDTAFDGGFKLTFLQWCNFGERAEFCEILSVQRSGNENQKK